MINFNSGRIDRYCIHQEHFISKVKAVLDQTYPQGLPFIDVDHIDNDAFCYYLTKMVAASTGNFRFSVADATKEFEVFARGFSAGAKASQGDAQELALKLQGIVKDAEALQILQD